MRKDRLYFVTFIYITIIYTIIAVVAYNYLVRASILKVLETHLELSKKESKTLSLVIGDVLNNKTKKQLLIDIIQKRIEEAENNSSFLAVYNWSGKIIIHPNIKNVGTLVKQDNAYVSSVKDNLTSESFYERFCEDMANSDYAPKVIALYPITNSDLIIASSIKTEYIKLQQDYYKKQYLVTLLIMGLILVVASVIILRYLSSKYEKHFELRKEKLEDEVINLSKLNRDIISYQEKISIEPEKINEQRHSTKTRILTYTRNELVPMPTDDIAYIFTENTITYVVDHNNKQTTTNVSLDELFSQLDSTHFFRANRQFIISINSLNKIVKYGNNQLKILVKPNTETDIIISKNKASQFKKWLNT